METPLRERLVGAAVLLALAVIFLPMLLNGAGREARLSLAEPVPPEPIFQRPLPAPIEEQRPVSTIPPLPVEPPPVVHESPPPPAQATALVEATPPPPAEPRTLPPVRAPEPNTPVAGGWVVQVGSFGQEANARSEAERLRQAGFPAFVERTSADGRVLYRVKVGPKLERHGAQSLQARLQAEQSLRGIVVTHP